MTDNERMYALLGSFLIGVIVVLASPILVYWSRRGGAERRRRVGPA